MSQQRWRTGSFAFKWEYPKIFTVEGIFIVLLLLYHQCNPDSLSGENYSEEVPEPWSSKRVFRLFVNNSEKYSHPNVTLKHSASETNYEILPSDPVTTILRNITSNLVKKSGELSFKPKSGQRQEETYSYDLDQNYNPFLGLFPNVLPLSVPTKRTGVSSNRVHGIPVMGSESAFKGLHQFKNAQREPQIYPASHIDSSHAPNIKVYKPKKKLQKRRKQTPEPLHRYPAFSSIKEPRPPYSGELHRNNVSLKATFLTPETEESSSIELELSSTENQETKIEFANPESQCVRLLDTNRKRTLLNIWSFSNGKLKLESQREVPPSIFNGSKLVDGELLNRAEIPEPVSKELSTLLTGIGRTDNVTLLTHFHLPTSGENIFGGNRRRNVIMLHYILWGDREKAWRVMLDRTVESYLRNYFLSAFSSGRSSTSRGPINWRMMRNVLLSFMASPDANCTEKLQGDTRIVQREELVSGHPLKPMRRPGPLGPVKRRPQGSHTLPTQNGPITRDEYGGGYGWQQNGWGAVKQQGWGATQHQGWGWDSEPQGWGWEDQGGKKGKKKKGKKKKKKKKGKKKKGKKKKGKKKKGKKGGGDGWGGWEPEGWGEPQGWGAPQGWGWSPPKGQGWGPIKWSSFEVNIGEIAHKGLALVGLFGLPIALFVGACVLIYLFSSKHGGGWAPHIYSSYHQSAPTPQIVYSGGFPRFGWRRRTEGPYDYGDTGHYGSPSTKSPEGWKYSSYQSHHPTMAPRNMTYTTPNIYYTIKPIKTPPQTFADIKKSNGFQYNRISDSYPRIRNQGDSVSSTKEYEKRNYNYDPYYADDHYYEANSHHYKYQQIPSRTKQEEDLVKILSKHKKARLEKLLQKWKLKNMQKSWW